MIYEIKSRWDGSVLWSGETETLAAAVSAAVASDANLRGADLRGANLSAADLSDANLRGADLRGANLSAADLSDANLRGANLSGAYLSAADLSDANLSAADLSDANLRGADLRASSLRGADLRGADLRDANLSAADLSDASLSGAYLSGAYLSAANLRGANLSGAYLSAANLCTITSDLWSVLDAAPAEVPALVTALRDGRIDGSCYQGACACLVGTLANARGCEYTEIPGLEPDAYRPAERWFLGIRPGMPATDARVSLTLEWLEQWGAVRGVEAWARWAAATKGAS